jgi:hypothetical protein
MEVSYYVKQGRNREGRSVLCMISGFCHTVAENCALLGYYTASSHNYHYFLCNNPVEHNSQGR